jgi:hypothetical protein
MSKTIASTLNTIDADAETFVLVGPNIHTRKIEVHVCLPREYCDQVLDAITETILLTKGSDHDVH